MVDPEPARADLRDAVERMRRPLDARVLRAASDRAVAHLAGLHAIQRARTVAVHVPAGGDLDPRGLTPILAERGIRVLLVDADDQVRVVATGRAHLVRDDAPTPDLGEVDVAVLPGIAFDLDGGRLGAAVDGWERVLARLPVDAVRIGLAHTTQLVPRVPREGDDDRAVDVVVTDRGVHHTGARSRPRDA